MYDIRGTNIQTGEPFAMRCTFSFGSRPSAGEEYLFAFKSGRRVLFKVTAVRYFTKVTEYPDAKVPHERFGVDFGPFINEETGVAELPLVQGYVLTDTTGDKDNDDATKENEGGR